MRITNQQKKQLNEIRIKYDLNLLDFEVTGEYQDFKIKLKKEPFYFSIHKIQEDLYMLKIASISNIMPDGNFRSWEKVLEDFDLWTMNLSNELNTSSGWESFGSYNFLNTSFTDLEKDFTTDEKEQIKQCLFELQSRIKLLNLATENLITINLKLDSLSLKIDKLNKFDWKSLFIGTIANLVMTMVIPPELTGIVWEHIKSSFNDLKITG